MIDSSVEKCVVLDVLMDKIVLGCKYEVWLGNLKEFVVICVLWILMVEVVVKISDLLLFDKDEDFGLVVWVGILLLKMICGVLVYVDGNVVVLDYVWNWVD